MESIGFISKNEVDDNDRLFNLYGRNWSNLVMALKPIIDSPVYAKKPALPLLLCPINDCRNWNNADMKVMVFGRETNNWNIPGKQYYKLDLKSSADIHKEIDDIQEIYNAYFNFGDGDSSRFNVRGPQRFISMLGDVFKGKSIDYLWNNICKIGWGNPDATGECCGLTPEYIYNVELEKFNVVKEEVEILKPDVLIFMTGREHNNIADKYIIDHFGDIEFSDIDSNQNLLRRVSIPGVKYAARIAQHPTRASNQDLDEMYRAIIEDMKRQGVL